jgi:hypothetical protein
MKRSLFRALLFALLLIALGDTLSLLMHVTGTPWYLAESLENTMTGLIGGAAAFLYINERRQRAERRLEELAYLNHHIRNALAAITLAPYAATEDMRLKMISDASARIERAIRKMSEQEHVSLQDSEDATMP